jgi:16S rRNA G966 N2-methylase RsmD
MSEENALKRTDANLASFAQQPTLASLEDLAELDALTERINAKYHEVEEMSRATLAGAIDLGRMLVEKKGSLEHGSWLSWVKHNFDGSERHAQRFMKLYNEREMLRASLDATRVSDLSLRGAMRRLREGKAEARREQLRLEASEAARGTAPSERCSLVHGDFREVLKDTPAESVDLMLTDPPYNREALPLYSDLSREAMRLLVPGGFLVSYAGVFYVNEVHRTVEASGLDYYWQFAVTHTDAYIRMVPRSILNGWKAIIAWRKPSEASSLESGATLEEAESRALWISDVLKSEEGPDPKLYHDWQQPMNQATKMVETFSEVGALVLDPMAGSGTIPLAAALSGRRGVGVEIDAVAYEIALERVRLALTEVRRR